MRKPAARLKPPRLPDITVEKRDWLELLLDFRRKGYSQRDIAAALDRSESTINRWTSGAEPTHSNGEALLLLYDTVFPAPIEEGTSRPACGVVALDDATKP